MSRWISDERITQFMTEAACAGDLDAVSTCNEALCGDDIAREQVADMVRPLTFEEAWFAMFGDRDEDRVVEEFDLAGACNVELDEWVGENEVASGIDWEHEGYAPVGRKVRQVLATAIARAKAEVAIVDLHQAGGYSGVVRSVHQSVGSAASAITDADWYGYASRVVRVERDSVAPGDTVAFAAADVVSSTDLSEAM